MGGLTFEVSIQPPLVVYGLSWQGDQRLVKSKTCSLLSIYLAEEMSIGIACLTIGLISVVLIKHYNQSFKMEVANHQ